MSDVILVILGILAIGFGLLKDYFLASFESDARKRKIGTWSLWFGFSMLFIGGPFQTCNSLEKVYDAKDAKVEHAKDDSVSNQTNMAVGRTDTNVKLEGKETRDSLASESKKTRDSIRYLKNQLDKSERQKLANLCPYLDVKASGYDVSNPNTYYIGKDTLGVKTRFNNSGNLSAMRICVSLWRCGKKLHGSWMKNPRGALEIFCYPSTAKVTPGDFIEQATLFIGKTLEEGDTLFWGAAGVYKDSINRQYRMPLRLFKWAKRSIGSDPIICGDDEIEAFQKEMGIKN